MTRIEQIRYLNKILLDEMPEFKEKAELYGQDIVSQRRLLRSLMNLRMPEPLSRDFLKVQDELLGEEREEKGIVDPDDLPTIGDQNIALWQGDITRLSAGAIVNAANSALLGCFVPCHGCIDNAIHSAAGLQLRDECEKIMRRQGFEEPAGQAKITKGYNLPAEYVIHTVGPIVQTEPTENDREVLISCYRSCLELAVSKKLRSIAFCCISTGVFQYPSRQAAQAAIDTVRDFLKRDKSGIRVVFDVFTDSDRELYEELLA